LGWNALRRVHALAVTLERLKAPVENHIGARDSLLDGPEFQSEDALVGAVVVAKALMIPTECAFMRT
jgi:hypothetical protein